MSTADGTRATILVATWGSSLGAGADDYQGIWDVTEQARERYATSSTFPASSEVWGAPNDGSNLALMMVWLLPPDPRVRGGVALSQQAQSITLPD